jgi:hypothetical protein
MINFYFNLSIIYIGVPGFFGQYPVPPPPPYINQINGNPFNVSNMQMIGSYPMMMNAQTGWLHNSFTIFQ